MSIEPRPHRRQIWSQMLEPFSSLVPVETIETDASAARGPNSGTPALAIMLAGFSDWDFEAEFDPATVRMPAGAVVDKSLDGD